MASVDYIQSGYTLMPVASELEAAASSVESTVNQNTNNASNITGKRDRTYTAPVQKLPPPINTNQNRRFTNVGEYVRNRPNPSTIEQIPLLGDNSVRDITVENGTTEYVPTQDGENSIQEDTLQRTELGLEQDDILLPLSSVTNSAKPRGILKRYSTMDSDCSSCPEIPSETSSLVGLISEGAGSSKAVISRRESKVTFVSESDGLPKTTDASDGNFFELQPIVNVHTLSNETDSHSPDIVAVETDEGLLIQEIDREEGPKLRQQSSTKRMHRPHPRRKLQRLQSQLDLNDLSRNELELKANLFFHIGNPIKRWRVERVVPIKLFLQLLKTFCLIVQVVLFTRTMSHQRSEFFYDSRIVFESLFIKSFKEGSTKPRDVYTAFSIQDMYSQFDHIAKQYFSIPDITIGGYDYVYFDELGNPPPVTLELKRYTAVEFNTSSNSYTLDGNINTTTFYINKGENATQVYLNFSQDPLFHKFVSLTVSVPIKNIRIVNPEKAECNLFTVRIFYESDMNSGKINYYLREEHNQLKCYGDIDTGTEKIPVTYGALTVLDVMICIMCMLSITLTVFSLRRAAKLAKAMGTFYQRELDIKLSWWERRSLFPFWHAINTISDLLILLGSLYKIFLDHQVNGLDDASPTRVLLGTAILFQAGVMLRYVSYFKELNALNRTLYLAFPELLKFLLCAGILFIAFAITGWIVIGPFHEKFIDLNKSIESLFGLLNGDDIYNTFTLIDTDDNMAAYVYSRFYLYIFLALFIYAVLNLFTGLVITAHEASQEYDTAYGNEVRRFIFSGPLTPQGVALRDVTSTKKYVDPEVIKRRLKKRETSPRRSRSSSRSQSIRSDRSLVTDFTG